MIEIEDRHGIWKKENESSIFSILTEPSENYLSEREMEKQQQLEQELIDSLKPSEKEVLMAEMEINTLNLLLDMEVI